MMEKEKQMPGGHIKTTVDLPRTPESTDPALVVFTEILHACRQRICKSNLVRPTQCSKVLIKVMFHHIFVGYSEYV
jgi:hypothetical protein